MVRLEKIKEIGIISIGDIVGGALGAIFWFYLASQMEPDTYGEIQWFLGIAGALSYIALFGSHNTITIYVAKKVEIQSTFNFISLVASFLISIIVILIIPSFYKIDIGLILFAYVINSLSVGDLLGRKLYSTYSKYVLLQKILTIILGIGFFHLFGYESIILALAISYIFYLKRIIRNFKEIKINFSLIKPRLGFIINNYLLLLVSGFHGQIDKILVAPILGFTVLGNYSLALQMLTVMMLSSNILFKYLLSEDASGNSNKNLKIFGVLGSMAISLLGIFLLPIIIPLYFPKFTSAVEAIPLISIFVIPNTISLIWESKLLSKLKSKYVLIGNVVSFGVMILGMIVLGTILGIIGIACSLLLNSLIRCGFFYYGIKRLDLN